MHNYELTNGFVWYSKPGYCTWPGLHTHNVPGNALLEMSKTVLKKKSWEKLMWLSCDFSNLYSSWLYAIELHENKWDA